MKTETPTPLRLYRTLFSLRQSDLAERAGVSTLTVSRIERGEVRPQRRTARALAAALNVDPKAAFPDLDWQEDGQP